MEITSLNKISRLFISKFTSKKIENGIFILSAGIPTPLTKTLHFGTKPGHVLLYIKKKDSERGKWLLTDAGYINYFRADTHASENDGIYNTLSDQKLFSIGFIFRLLGYVFSLSILPFHLRKASLELTKDELIIEDYFLFRKSIVFNHHDKRSVVRKWFYNKEIVSLLS